MHIHSEEINKIMEDDMNVTCRTHEGYEKYVTISNCKT